MESADDELKSGDEPNVQRPARVAGRHGADGQGNGQTAGHTGHGGDTHGRKWDRAGSCPGFRAGSSGCCFELVQWTRLERPAPANHEWRYRKCVGQLCTGRFPQEKGRTTALAAGTCRLLCSWIAGHFEHDLDGDDPAEVKLLPGTGFVVSVRDTGGIQEN